MGIIKGKSEHEIYGSDVVSEVALNRVKSNDSGGTEQEIVEEVDNVKEVEDNTQDSYSTHNQSVVDMSNFLNTNTDSEPCIVTKLSDTLVKRGTQDGSHKDLNSNKEVFNTSNASNSRFECYKADLFDALTHRIESGANMDDIKIFIYDKIITAITDDQPIEIIKVIAGVSDVL